MYRIITVYSLLVICTVRAYPDGSPLSACRSMQPGQQMGEMGMYGHTEPPQNEFPTYGRPVIPPYNIVINPLTANYQPNAVYNVYVLADQIKGWNSYTGVFLQARRVTCYGNNTIAVEDEALGRFTVAYGSLLQTLDCNENADSAISHRTRQMKINETSQWHAPDQYVGHVAFWATIVQEDVVYWMGAHSTVLLDPTIPPPVPCKASPVQQSVFGALFSCLLMSLVTHVCVI